MKRILTSLLLIALTVCSYAAGEYDLTNKQWKAFWITMPGATETGYGVYHFAKDVSLAEVPASYIVHCTADNRYKLYVNGQLVSLGPALSDIHHWNYETIDIAKYLHAGKNRLAAIVWNDGPQRAGHQMTFRTGFLLQASTKQNQVANTNASWRCEMDKSHAQLEQHVIGFLSLEPGEVVDMNRYNSQWLSADYDISAWAKAEPIGIGQPLTFTGMRIGSGEWQLIPSTIPQMERSEVRIPAAKFPMTVLANTTRTILLDQTYLVNAYPTLTFSHGKNATMTLGYAEAFYDEHFHKNNRNETKGKRFIGRTDSIISNGSEKQQFVSLDWRTYRYLQLTIHTGNEPLMIDDYHGVFTGYPFENRTTFASSDPQLKKMLEIGWRTARLCAGETYFDCPYYEQSQYGGDTRIQCLVSYYNAGDDRLARRAIDMLDYSRSNEGLIQACYPAHGRMFITPYALSWIGMLYDYYYYRGDTAFVKKHLRGSRQVLDFFSDYQAEDGSLVNLPYWHFTDWNEGNTSSWRAGAPKGDENETSSVIDLQLLYALQMAAKMEHDIGMPAYGDLYAQQAAKLSQTIRQKYWNAARGLFADDPQQENYSQHANILAIITDVTTKEEAPQVLGRILTDSTLTKASLYFQYYLFQAMRKAGCGSEFLTHLGTWRQYMNLGMTTWGEDSKVMSTRSDCHAWSASPNIEMFRTVLGIDTDAPGFSDVVITPNLGNLTNASGSIPHPLGNLSVSYTKRNKHWDVQIKLPQGLHGRLVWQGETKALNGGDNKFRF